MAIARQKVEAYSPIGVLDLMVSSMDRGVREVPDIIEFVTSDAYLGRPQLYPRQATLLKIIFLQDELFCADEKTEILTRRGWMPYDQVREGEDVMTLSVDGHAEWSPAERINVFPVEDEPLVLMEGENHSSLTTPNHRWLVERLYQSRSGNRRDIEFIETKDLQKRDRIACAAPVANLPSERIWDDSFVELAAWYWTEGHAIAGLRGGIKITQSKRVNPEYVDRIRACLIDLFGPAQDSLWGSLDGPAWREDPADGGMVSFRLNSLASEELRFVAPGEEKIVRPDFLASLTQGQLDLYLDTSIAADGWESGGSRHLTQKSLGRIDSFQMACSLAGVRTTVRLDATRGTSKYAGRPFWSITLNEGRRYFSPQPRKETRRVGFAITEVRHTGTVWCPTTANGTWLARRNGTVYFTGNTEFDLDVIGQWCEGFVAPDPDRAKAMVQGKKYRFEGEWGIQPDVLERIRINKADGRKWFREVVAAVGRRGSKGFLGAFCGAYVLAHFVMRGDVHKTYGIDPGKRFAAFVYAAKKGQAIENQWGDLNRVITEAPFFQQRMGRAMSESLSIKGAEDDTRMRKMNAAGVFPLGDRSTFLIDPKESTMVSGRGPASFMQFYDEMAHITREVAKADAKQIYDQAKPALDQFGKDAFIYEGSSTWQMLGQFYENWENALEIDPITHAPKRPNMLMFQLCSWDPYEDYERANDIPRVNVDFDPSVNRNYVFDRDYHIRPGAGPKTFGHMPENPPSLYDEEMRLEEEANPETFAVERRCLDPETLVLCADLTWRPIKSLTVGDEVISVDEEPLEAGKQRKMRTATVKATWRNTDTAYRLTFEDGTSVVCSGNHRWLSASKGSGGEQLASFRWRTIKADPHKPGPRVGIRVGDSIRHLVDPWEEDNSWEAGYLAGVYDGEGTAIGYPRREYRVSFVQNPGETLDATLLYLKQKGFEPVHIPTKVPAQVYVIRGFADCLRFVGQMGGHKMRRQAVPHLWEGRGIGRAKGRSSHKIVTSIEELPAQEMVDIETSTGTFLAEGLVSHNSKWATAMNAYLNAAKVDAMFEPFGPDNEIHLVQKSRGILSTMYRAHGDPSSVSANFGWAIGHVEYPEWDVRGLPHVYFDKVHAWVPREFPNGEIDYIKIGQDLQYDVRAFAPELVTFDQWNSISTIQEMRADVRDNPLPNHVVIEERTATNELNWRTAETFKVALNLGLIHAPQFDLAREELKFLQDLGNKKIDKPSTGPVQTKDVADCYDDQTEVLTYSGWKLFADVQEGEPVATRSPSGVLEFQIPTAGVARPYSGPMYTYDGERLNFAVTPGHRMLVSTYEAPDWRFVEAKDLTSKRYRVPKTASPLDPVDGWMDFDADQRACVVNTCQEGRGGHGRPSWTKDEDGYLSSMYASSPMEDLCSILGRSRGAIYGRAKKLGLKRGQIGDRVGDLPDRLPKTDRADFAAFLGIWLAEGAKTRRGYEVLISQTKPAGIEWIDTLMVRLGWPVYRRQTKTGEVVWGVKSRGLRDYLRQCVDGSDLSIPEEVFHLWSLREREALLDGLMVGDGTSGVNGRTYYSSSRRLIDDVQRLLIHLGRQGRVRRISEAGDQRSIRGIDFVATKPGYSIHENISDTATIETDRIEQVDYAGMVYCLTVPNGTLLTRRAGIPFWAGNCLMIVVHSLIGDVMDAYIKRDLAATRLGGALQGGTLPNGSVPSVHDQLSATGNRSSSSPARTSQARRGTGGGRGATPRTSGKRRRG